MSHPKAPSRPPQTAHALLRSARVAMSIGAAALALPAAAQDTTEAPRDVEASGIVGPAMEWRFLFGPDLEGAMRLSEVASARTDAAIGFFVLNVGAHGFYEGVYNVREDGASIVGVFWPEGVQIEGPLAGILDVGFSPTDPSLGPLDVRVTFLDSDEVVIGQAR